MRRILSVLGAGVVCAVLAACPSTYPNCKSDENCKEHGELCVQGQCVECSGDANCKTGFTCQGNKCIPKPECDSDATCGKGKKCTSGKCVVHECEKDGECGAGKCQNNRCLPAGCKETADCTGNQECKEGQCIEPSASDNDPANACKMDPIRFGFNEHSLPPEARSQLDALADCIKKKNLKLNVEGHADERGTEEYNLQLSNRRAAAVKRYLVDLGVKADKLASIGFGENRPVENGSTEAAWTANRRVEFKKP